MPASQVIRAALAVAVALATAVEARELGASVAGSPRRTAAARVPRAVFGGGFGSVTGYQFASDKPTQGGYQLRPAGGLPSSGSYISKWTTGGDWATRTDVEQPTASPPPVHYVTYNGLGGGFGGGLGGQTVPGLGGGLGGLGGGLGAGLGSVGAAVDKGGDGAPGDSSGAGLGAGLGGGFGGGLAGALGGVFGGGFGGGFGAGAGGIRYN